MVIMKKFLVLILSVVAVFAAILSLTACDNKPSDNGGTTITDGDKLDNGGNNGSQENKGDEAPEHSHTYNKQVATQKYLKSAATCTAKAVYYFSCECGEKGTQTFEYGNKLPHTFNKQIAEEKYLKSAATCTAKATYYYSCVCGEKGTQTFEYGEKLPHTYDKQVAEEKYLKSMATCTAKATYYYSCECGEKGTQTFEYGEKLPHTYDKQIIDETYLKSVATCTAKAVYYYSCKCGLASDSETFEYGEILPHEYNDSYICTNCSYKCQSDGLSFELSTDNNSYVCTGLGTFDGKILIIPRVYNGKPVTKIEEDAFKNATDITDVLIADSVTEVGFNAFGGCSNITKMVLPFVGAYADGSGDENFGYIFGASSYSEQGQKLPSGLKTVVLSDTITKIGDGAFSGCSKLTRITIPDGVMSIGNYAFYECSKLTSVTIGNSVTSIGQSAFDECRSLTNVTIGDSVTSIGQSAFAWCSSLKTIYYNGDINGWVQINGLGNLMRSNMSLYINGELLTEAVIDTATEIKSCAFRGCSSLTSITIPNSMTSIGIYAFDECRSLTNVTIGDSVTSIGAYAFEGCTSLEFNKYDNGLYLGNETNKYVALIKPKTQGVKSITINNKCKVIGSCAFYNCSSLKTINYKGSKEQWDSISKGSSWNYNTGSCTINYNYVEN